MLNLTIRYAHDPASGRMRPVRLSVPNMGLTARQWAHAVFLESHVPAAALRGAAQHSVPGLVEVAEAMARVQSANVSAPLAAGDTVTVGGERVRCLAVDDELPGPWGVGTPTFAEAEALPLPVGPAMYVSAEQPPPDAVAYVEDFRDRLWTGRGAGEWRCLTDPAGRTFPGQWASVWLHHGPLTPLVPVARLEEPDGREWEDPHRASLPGPSAVSSLSRALGTMQ